MMKILFVHSGNETFVKLDRDLLSTFFKVQDFYAARKFPIGLLQYLDGIKITNTLFCWFASWNSLWALIFARLFRKPSVLVIGGYDLANLPEANYGNQRSVIGKWTSRFAMKLATVIITNSNFSREEAEQNAGIPSARVRVIYHGVPDPYGSLPEITKERMALTVGKVDWPNLKRKGLEPFVRAAAKLLDVQFVLVGDWADDSIEYLRSIASINVTFAGRVNDKELLEYYQRASVYVQASLHEGFGLSVAEAMLAGCIPVVTRRGSLPEVVGECGLYCEIDSSESIASSILATLDLPVALRIRARERILNEFPVERRKLSLEKIVQIGGRKFKDA